MKSLFSLLAFQLFSLLAFQLLGLLAVEGWQDETGFHHGRPPESLLFCFLLSVFCFVFY